MQRQKRYFVYDGTAQCVATAVHLASTGFQPCALYLSRKPYTLRKLQCAALVRNVYNDEHEQFLTHEWHILDEVPNWSCIHMDCGGVYMHAFLRAFAYTQGHPVVVHWRCKQTTGPYIEQSPYTNSAEAIQFLYDCEMEQGERNSESEQEDEIGWFWSPGWCIWDCIVPCRVYDFGRNHVTPQLYSRCQCVECLWYEELTTIVTNS